MSSRSATMPFGKFKGHALSDLPIEYLDWLSTRELREPLCSAVREELRRRNAYSAPRPPIQVDGRIIRDLIEAGRRSLARKYHPDVGGSTIAMQEVNITADWCLEQFRRHT